MTYRNLTEQEISTLESQGCFCRNWHDCLVKEPFDPQFIRNVSFQGLVKIGSFYKTGNLQDALGLRQSSISDCTLGNNVCISNVSLLKSYDVEDDVTIRNVGTLEVDGPCTFGNGTSIEVLNEGGGRTIKIYDGLTAQIAYLLAVYRHRPAMIKQLNVLIDDYVQSCISSRGMIGKSASLINCQTLKNIKVGAYSSIEGANRLENGAIVSDEVNPVRIGNGVFAKNFIIQSGSTVDSSAILTDVFVGQAVKIGKQFSAENSAFFANCEGFHGEACSIFAGPYTVTHHKSTLLIAGLFSFYNAGSGTNQSNHMYKLGPNHQGILQRGSKTGSFSYLLWPCAIGPFSVVIGKHYANFDTTDLPFSYLNEEDGKSVLTPAMNLLTVGTQRDSQKWPSRDRRKGEHKLDLIHFDLFNPFTIGKVISAARILQDLYANASKENEYVQYQGVHIKRLLLKTCRKYYDIAIKIFVGDCMIDRLEELSNHSSFEDWKKTLLTQDEPESFEWVDICGLLAPASSIEKLVSLIEAQEITTVAGVTDHLRTIYDEYDANKWDWLSLLIEKIFSTSINDLSKDQFIQIVNDWKTNSTKLNKMVIQDAQKEFDQNARIGYGIDGDDAIREQDFDEVRGKVETNSFIKGINDAINVIEVKSSKVIEKLEQLN